MASGVSADGALAQLGREPGTYALWMATPEPLELVIGRLGRRRFPAGHYLYLGSARGPGGLAARLGRHRRLEKRQHWHIDYLRSAMEVQGVWALASDEALECRWAQAAAILPGAAIPVGRFGASDCRCPAHLVHLQDPSPLERFAALVGATLIESIQT